MQNYLCKKNGYAKMNAMKRYAKYQISFVIALAFVAVGAFFALSPKATASASTGSDYLSYKGISNVYKDQQNGIKIIETPASQTNLVSYLTITVDNWTPITEFTIKRIVSNHVYTVSNDDTNTTIALGSSSEFTFYQNGAYVVIYKINTDDITRAIYTDKSFYRTISLDAISASNEANIFNNAQFDNDIANVVVAENGSTTLSINSINADLYSATFSDAGTVNTQNKQINLSIKHNQSESIIYTTNFEVFCVFPEYVYNDNENNPVDDVFKDWVGVKPTEDLFFNKNVTVSPNYSGMSENEIEFITNRFTFTTGSISTESNNYQSFFALKSDSTQKFNIQNHTVCTSPNNDLIIRIGSTAETAPIYNLADNATNIFTVVTGMYPTNKNDGYIVVNEEDMPMLTESQTEVVLYGATEADPSKVVFAYKLTFVLYKEGDAKISLSKSGNTITITRIQSISVPIDLSVKDRDTGEVFVQKDLFKNIADLSVELEFATNKSYQIDVQYRDSPHTESSVWFHGIIQLTTNGSSIYLTSDGHKIINGQISNHPVRVSVSDGSTYNVYQNSILIGENISVPTEYSENGYYTIVSGNNTSTFSIISTASLNTYTISNPKNATLVSIKKNGEDIDISNITKINETGSYTITYSLQTAEPVTIDGESVQLFANTEFSYQINISHPSFSVKANVANGSTSSKNIVIYSVNATGDYTVSVTKNGKTKTYTGAQFAALNKKARTFSKTGTYQIKVTDGGGAEYVFSFQKYYSMGVGLILLIGIVGALAVVGFVLLIRLRLRGRVK